MRVLVALKRVIDSNARVRVKPDKVCCVRFVFVLSRAVLGARGVWRMAPVDADLDAQNPLALQYYSLQSGVDLKSVKMGA